MTVDDVSALLGAPPADRFPVDWAGVEARLGVGLPADYKEFGSAYGPVTVGGWLTVLVPRRAGQDYFADLDRRQGNEQVRRDLDPPANPYAFHPEPGGLLLWATSDSEVELFWDTGAGPDPDGWPTVAGSRDDWQPLPPMSTTEVLAALLRGELEVGPAAPRPLPATWTTAHGGRSPLVVQPAAAGRTADELRAAGAAFAATLQVDPDGGSATPAGGTRPMPADYAELLDRVGPGLLAGTLRLLAPAAAGGTDGATAGAADLDMDGEQARHADRIRARRADHPDGAGVVPAPFAPEPAGLRLWGVFRGGETCWWLPVTRDPAGWPLLLVDADGVGWQRLNLSTTAFLGSWLAGELDPPVLPDPPVRREPTLSRAGRPPATPPAAGERDPLAQLETLIGPGRARTYDWASTETDLGLPARLPADFRRLVETHGPLEAGPVRVVDPAKMVDFQVDRVQSMEYFDPPSAQLLFPQPGGMLACGSLESGEVLYWETNGADPDKWPVARGLPGDTEFHTYPCTLTELIIAELTARADPRLGMHTPSQPLPVWRPA